MASPYFKNLLASKKKKPEQLEFSSMSANAFRALIRFCYTGKLAIDSDNVDELMKAANTLQLAKAIELCKKFCCDATTEENCLQILANTRSAEFKTRALHMSLDYFPKLVGTEAFLGLDAATLESLLSSADVSVYSELDLFNALVGWIRYDENVRKCHFDQLVRHICFCRADITVSTQS